MVFLSVLNNVFILFQPVRFLEGELIHDLLTIFVGEKLPGYLKFYNDHKEFISSVGKYILCGKCFNFVIYLLFVSYFYNIR